MANKKNKLNKPSKSSAGLNFKVRFKPEQKGGHFVVTNRKRKPLDGKQFKSHDEALAYAKELHEATFKK